MSRYEGQNRRSNEWHLDKKVPIVILFMIAAQVITSVWWAAEMTAFSRANYAKNVEQEKRLEIIESRERESFKVGERLVRLEVITENTNVVVRRLESYLDNKPKGK